MEVDTWEELRYEVHLSFLPFFPLFSLLALEVVVEEVGVEHQPFSPLFSLQVLVLEQEELLGLERVELEQVEALLQPLPFKLKEMPVHKLRMPKLQT
jgi:hypothetical protein